MDSPSTCLLYTSYNCACTVDYYTIFPHTLTNSIQYFQLNRLQRCKVSIVFIVLDIWLAAVSYTHLDVTLNRSFRSSGLFRGQIMNRSQHGVGPVSYTHLDVYKRQLLKRTVSSKKKLKNPAFFAMLNEFILKRKLATL